MGLLALAVALIVAMVDVPTAGAAAPESDADAETSLLAPGNAEGDIDAFWGRMFAEADIAYAAPAVVPFSAPVSSGCGYVTPAEVIAFHCMVDGAVYWSVPSYEASYAGGGDAAWINVMAHEWSHHAQVFLGTNTAWRQANDMVGLELEATCMGGAYVDWARDRGLVTDDMIATMIGMFVGSPYHGTTEQVRSAFATGLDTGLAGCGVALPADALAAARNEPEAAASVAKSDGGTDDQDQALAKGDSAPQAVRVIAPGVNLRSNPSLSAPVAEVVGPTSHLEITGAPQSADGYTWYPVTNLDTDASGYVAEQFLDV